MPDDAPPSRRVLVTAVSARAMAESAARAGYAVTALDAFADLDQHPAVQARTVRSDPAERFSTRAVVQAARRLRFDALAYGASFENHPHAVRALARGRMLLGNGPSTLRRVRDPLLLAQALGRRRLPAPRVVCDGTTPAGRAGEWLMKPRASGGGHGVRVARPGERVPRGWYAQERLGGVAGSVTFVAAGGSIRVLGTTQQIVGEAGFGADGFRYCGSLLLPADSAAPAASVLAQAIAEEFALVGVNGVDFIVCDGAPVAIEVNPRWCASLELVERVTGESMFAAHAGACATGSVAPASAPRSPSREPVVGKAILFARHDTLCGDTRDWLRDSDVRDVPGPGTRIAVGRPVCTIFASGDDVDSCRDALLARARAIYETLAASSSVPA